MASQPDVAEVPADPTNPPKAPVHPTKGRRFRVLPGEDGDVCIVNVVGEGHKVFPAGTLLPIEGAPRFETSTEAVKWCKGPAGDVLHGMRVMIFHVKELFACDVSSKPVVKLTFQPKRQVQGPPVE